MSGFGKSRSAIVAQLVDRLRDARTRVRLSLAISDELDALLDEAAREIEQLGEDVDALASMVGGPLAKELQGAA